MNEAIAPIDRTEVVMKIVWKHFLGSAATFPAGSGAKLRPAAADFGVFEPRCDASPWRRSKLYAITKKIQKKILVRSVAVGLFHEWA